METAESTLLALLIILSFGLIVPELFKKVRIPFITSLILIGSILGPNGINYVQSNEIIHFFGFLGMTFLMLMAGLETNLGKLKKLGKKIFTMVAFNSAVPFFTGVIITKSFGYSWLTSFLIGVIFISSSVAVIIPSLKSAGLFHKNIGRLILSAVLIADILSLVLLSFILQGTSPITKLPLPLYFIIIIISVALLFLIVPWLANYLFHEKFPTKTGYETHLRIILIIIIGVLVYFSALGVHPILAAFIVGLTLSKIVKHEAIFTKIHTLGYGLFVPVFFFIVGMELDLSILTHFDIRDAIIVSIVLGLIGSKFLSGYLGGRIAKLSGSDSAFFGLSSIIQLTTTLAVTYAASSLGILDSTLVTSVIILAIITTILGPVSLRILYGSVEKKPENKEE